MKNLHTPPAQITTTATHADSEAMGERMRDTHNSGDRLLPAAVLLQLRLLLLGLFGTLYDLAGNFPGLYKLGTYIFISILSHIFCLANSKKTKKLTAFITMQWFDWKIYSKGGGYLKGTVLRDRF
jgi:hypothetical protein